MIVPGSSLIYFGWQLFFWLFQIIFNQMIFHAKITHLTLELEDKDPESPPNKPGFWALYSQRFCLEYDINFPFLVFWQLKITVKLIYCYFK